MSKPAPRAARARRAPNPVSPVETRRVIDVDNHTVREMPVGPPPGFELDMSPEAIAYRAECAAEPDDPSPPPVILDINARLARGEMPQSY